MRSCFTAAVITAALAVVMALGTLPAAAAQPAVPENQPARLVFSTQNELRLPVISNFQLGNIPVAALFDLGAQSLLVSPAVFDGLGLSAQHTAESVTAGGTRYTSPASVITLSAPGTNRVLSLDIMANPGLLSATTAFDCVFPRSLVRTDSLYMFTSRGEIYLCNQPCPKLPFSTRISERIGGVQVVSVWETGSGLLVPVLVGGEHLYFFKLDTGASVSSINMELAKGHPGYLRITGKTSAVIISSGGTAYQPVIEIVAGCEVLAHSGGIALAGLEVNADGSVPAALPITAAEAIWPNYMVPAGTLGMDFLGSYDLAIDFEQHVLLLWPPESTPLLFR